jgi:hypothetical protein
MPAKEGRQVEVRAVLCEICWKTIVVRGRQRRRWCSSYCRVRAGHGSWYDRLVVDCYNEAGRPVTALHEAGHAIVGRSLGWPVDEVHIEATGQELGVTNFIGHGRHCDDDPIEAATVDLAGYVAEWIDGGPNGPASIIEWVLGPYRGDGDDFNARTWMWQATGDDEQEGRTFVARAVRQAEETLRIQWADVDRLASALLHRETEVSHPFQAQPPESSCRFGAAPAASLRDRPEPGARSDAGPERPSDNTLGCERHNRAHVGRAQVGELVEP